MKNELPKSVLDAVIKLARNLKRPEKKASPEYKEGDDEAASWEWVDRYKQRVERQENYEYYKRWTERR